MKRQRVTYPNGGFAMHKLVGSWQGTISAYYERDGTLIDAERIDMGRSFPVKRGGPIWTRLENMGVVFADGPEPRLRRKNPAHRRNPVKSPRGWKIQTASANGWADVKSSDGGSYKTDYYSSKAEAQSELAELAETHGDYDSWRVVPASTRTNDDIYENPVHPRRGESERNFVSRCMSEEKMKFPKQKQRIAVCLSKARRNPFPDRNADE